ncbi:MAG: hypothetical protein ACODAQ_11535 [Phycisphaeraceae bacterium]
MPIADCQLPIANCRLKKMARKRWRKRVLGGVFGLALGWIAAGYAPGALHSNPLPPGEGAEQDAPHSREEGNEAGEGGSDDR